MAIVRCKSCSLDLSKTKRKYTNKWFKPLGYPKTALICGRFSCRNAGMVRLEQHEYAAYKKGERIFRIPSYATKIKLE